jgi:hypothetical protein
MNGKADSSQSQPIHDEIAELERRLEDAKDRLSAGRNVQDAITGPPARVLRSNGM